MAQGLLNHVAEHPVAQLRFEPRALGRHDTVLVGDFHEIDNTGRVHGKGDHVVALINEFFEFLRASDTPDKSDPFVRARVLDIKDGREDVILEE